MTLFSLFWGGGAVVLRAGGGKTLGGQGSRINDRFFVGGPVVMRGFRTKGLGPRAQVCGWVGEWVGGCVCIHIIYYTDIYIYTHTTDKTHARTHKHTHKHTHTHTHTHTQGANSAASAKGGDAFFTAGITATLDLPRYKMEKNGKKIKKI